MSIWMVMYLILWDLTINTIWSGMIFKKMRSGSVLQISPLSHQLREELETSERGVPHSSEEKR